jgi:predicted heme/steroid binding protein
MNTPFYLPCKEQIGNVCIDGYLSYPNYYPRVSNNLYPTGSKRQEGYLAYNGAFSTLEQCNIFRQGTHPACGTTSNAGSDCSLEPCCPPVAPFLNPLRCADNRCQVNVQVNNQGVVTRGCVPAAGRCGFEGDAALCPDLNCVDNLSCLGPQNQNQEINPQAIQTALLFMNVNLNPPALPAGNLAPIQCWQGLKGTDQIKYIWQYGNWVLNVRKNIFLAKCMGTCWLGNPSCQAAHNACVQLKQAIDTELPKATKIYKKILGKP